MKRLGFLIFLFTSQLAFSLANAGFTESSAIARGMEQPHFQSLIDSQLMQAEGAEAATGRWHNPEIEYNRESMDLLTGRNEETSWWVRQRINIAGVHGLKREAAAMTRAAAEARSQLERRQWQTQIRVRFYAVLATQTQLDLFTDFNQRLQQIAKMVEQRVARGDASRYDSLRVSQEVARIQSTHAQIQAEHSAEQQLLFSLIGGDAEVLSGSLLPPELIIDDEKLVQSLELHPQLQMLRALGQGADLGAKAARREAWPEVTLGVGRKTLTEAEYTADGYAVALGIEIPLFDRNQGEARQAQGLAREYAAEYALVYNQLRAQQQGLQINLSAQRESAQSLWHSVSAGDRSLTAIAEASYQAGELSLMELLDAYRTELDTWGTYLNTAQAARTTFIQLQHLEGK